MKIIQILPEVNAGGVERGTLELAAFLVAAGHEALVISNGGRLVAELERCGARHIALPVHRKSLASLWQVRRLRRPVGRRLCRHLATTVHGRRPAKTASTC